MPQPYALPELIGSRLESQNLGIRILYASDLAGATENTQVAQSLRVVPYQLSVIDAYNPAAISLKEVVLVVAVIRFSNQPSGQGARQIASPILAKVAIALSGWQPNQYYERLQIETPPISRIQDGYCSYPLQFSSKYQLSAT